MMLFISLFIGFVISEGALSSMRMGGSTAERLGEKLISATASISASVAAGNGDTAAESLREDVDGDGEVLASPKISEVIENANSMDTTEEDDLCKRDWKGCPDGWTQTGGVCRAPSTYMGGCSFVFEIEGATRNSKEKFARECLAPWPCEGSCKYGLDYDVCPIGWFENGGMCELSGTPPKNTKCGSRYIFDSMRVADKQALASACGIQWNCKTYCTPDYSVECPDTWISDTTRKTCIAPATYSGDCSYEVNVEGWHENEKEAFAAACAAPYPCAGSLGQKTGGVSVDKTDGSIGNGPVDVTGSIVEG